MKQESQIKAVDEIVEDLGQQDVLPSRKGTGEMAVAGADMGMEQVGSWNETVGGQPHRAARSVMEDETNAAEMLVLRGLSEAAEERSDLAVEETPFEDGQS